MKKEFILLIAVIAALSVYLVFQKTDKVAYELPLIPVIEKNDITGIEIKKQAESVRLNKTGSKWQAGDKAYIADNNKIEAMLKAIAAFDLSAMVSESKNYDRYDLSDEKKIHVDVWADKELLLSFDLGKTAGTRRHTFVKMADDDRVYHARGNFRNNFDVTEEEIRDKQVLALDKNEIQKIRFQKNGHTLVLSRQVPAAETGSEGTGASANTAPDPSSDADGIQWITEAGGAADTEAIDKLLAALADLRCQRFVYDQTRENLKDPVYKIALSGSREYTVTVYGNGEEEKNEYVATSSATEDPFILPKWQAEKIMPDLTALVRASEEETKQ